MNEKICDNCSCSYQGYGESSLSYGLRCNEYEKSVDENDTCGRWNPSTASLYRELKKQNDQLKELIVEACNKLQHAKEYVGLSLEFTDDDEEYRECDELGDSICDFINKPEIQKILSEEVL